MAREFFKNKPDKTTPFSASRWNGLLNGEEAMGSIVVDDVIGKNLFDKDDIIDGYYWAEGKLTHDSNMCCSNSFIKVEPNKTYTFSCGSKSTIFIEEYDASKTYIKLNSNWDKTEVSITTQSTTEYVRLSFTKASKDTTQFEKGTKTDYTPYKKFGYNSQESMGKIVVDDISYRNLFIKNTSTDNSYIDGTDGTLKYSGVGSVSDYIEVEASTPYITSYGNGYSEMSTYYKRIVFFDANKNIINYIEVSNTDVHWKTITPANTKYIRFQYPSVCKNEVQFKKEFSNKTDIITGQETPTNEYVDGKRVYVKRVNFGALPNTTTKSVAHGLTNFTPVRINGIANTWSYYINLPHVSITTTGNIQIGVSATEIEITTGQDRSGFTGIVDIYYTKTDTSTASTMSLRPDTPEEGELDG